MRSISTRSLTLLALTALFASGCTHPRSAQEIADAGSLTAANQKAAQSKVKTAPTPSSSVVIGKVSWASRVESMGVISLTVPPLPPGTILLARTGALAPVCIMETTQTSRGHTQGVSLLNGVPNTDDQVIQPGPEYDDLIRSNINLNNRHEAKTALQAAGSAAPTVVIGQ